MTGGMQNICVFWRWVWTRTITQVLTGCIWMRKEKERRNGQSHSIRRTWACPTAWQNRYTRSTALPLNKRSRPVLCRAAFLCVLYFCGAGFERTPGLFPVPLPGEKWMCGIHLRLSLDDTALFPVPSPSSLVGVWMIWRRRHSCAALPAYDATTEALRDAYKDLMCLRQEMLLK